MTIDEAIKGQERVLARGWLARRPELEASVRLGVEALKRVKEARGIQGGAYNYFLLGETKE